MTRSVTVDTLIKRICMLTESTFAIVKSEGNETTVVEINECKNSLYVVAMNWSSTKEYFLNALTLNSFIFMRTREDKLVYANYDGTSVEILI